MVTIYVSVFCVCVRVRVGLTEQQKCDPVSGISLAPGISRALLRHYIFGVACLDATKKKKGQKPLPKHLTPAESSSRFESQRSSRVRSVRGSVRTNNLALIPGGPSGVCICVNMCACTRMPHCPHSQLSIFQIPWQPFAPACPRCPTPVLLFDVFLPPSRPLSSSSDIL